MKFLIRTEAGGKGNDRTAAADSNIARQLALPLTLNRLSCRTFLMATNSLVSTNFAWKTTPKLPLPMTRVSVYDTSCARSDPWPGVATTVVIFVPSLPELREGWEKIWAQISCELADYFFFIWRNQQQTTQNTLFDESSHSSVSLIWIRLKHKENAFAAKFSKK